MPPLRIYGHLFPHWYQRSLLQLSFFEEQYRDLKKAREKKVRGALDSKLKDVSDSWVVLRTGKLLFDSHSSKSLQWVSSDQLLHSQFPMPWKSYVATLLFLLNSKRHPNFFLANQSWIFKTELNCLGFNISLKSHRFTHIIFTRVSASPITRKDPSRISAAFK